MLKADNLAKKVAYVQAHPEQLEALRAKDREHQKAVEQLKNLESNDATQALAALQTQAEVELAYE